MEILIGLLSGLFAAGGILGTKGLADRYLASKQRIESRRTDAEQGRETTIITAVMAMTKDLSSAMVDLTRDAINTNQVAMSNVITALDSHSRDSASQFSLLQNSSVETTRILDKNLRALASIEEKLDAVVAVIGNNGK